MTSNIATVEPYIATVDPVYRRFLVIYRRFSGVCRRFSGANRRDRPIPRGFFRLNRRGGRITIRVVGLFFNDGAFKESDGTVKADEEDPDL